LIYYNLNNEYNFTLFKAETKQIYVECNQNINKN